MSRSRGPGRARDTAGTRTSKPAAARAPPVSAISSHASSPLSTTSPRRALGRRRAGSSRSSRRRCHSTWRARTPLATARACSTARGWWSTPVTRARSSQPPSLSGGSSRTVKPIWPSSVTGPAQRLRSSATSVAGRPAALNGSPARPASTASATSPRVRATGTVAGATKREAPARHTVSTALDNTARHTVSLGMAASSTETAPGIRLATWRRRLASTRAGAHRTRCPPVDEPDPEPEPVPSPAAARRNVGTIRPCATSSVAHTATSASQRRLGATSALTSPVPIATSQPNVWAIDAERAFARVPSGTGTSPRRCHSMASAPASVSSWASGSSEPADPPGPPAHTTTRPADHEPCSIGPVVSPVAVSPQPAPALTPVPDVAGPSPATPAGVSPGSCPRRRRAAASRRRSPLRSSRTCSRSSPVMRSAPRIASSVSVINRRTAAAHASGRASSADSSAAVASPSASAATNASKFASSSSVSKILWYPSAMPTIPDVVGSQPHVLLAIYPKGQPPAEHTSWMSNRR